MNSSRMGGERRRNLRNPMVYLGPRCVPTAHLRTPFHCRSRNFSVMFLFLTRPSGHDSPTGAYRCRNGKCGARLGIQKSARACRSTTPEPHRGTNLVIGLSFWRAEFQTWSWCIGCFHDILVKYDHQPGSFEGGVSREQRSDRIPSHAGSTSERPMSIPMSIHEERRLDRDTHVVLTRLEPRD